MRVWSFALVLLVGCAEAAPEPPPDTPAADAPSVATGAARWAPVRRPADATILEHPATVVADPSSVGEVAAPFRARVAAVHVRAGQSVAAGDPVLDVVMPEVLAAAATVQGAGARIAAHRARAEELERLRGEGIVDASRVFEQRATIAELEAERAEALAVLRAASIDARDAVALLRRGVIALRAPASGVVRSLDARLGETREPGGAPFARIVGAGPARIEVRSSAPLPRDADATFEGTDGAVVPLAREPIARIVDPEDGTIVTWLAPREPIALEDGLRGRVRLSLAGDDLFEVPASAVVLGDGDDALVHRRTGDRSEAVRVRIVGSSGATAIVQGPLREGDVVATDPSALDAREGG